MNKRFFFDMDGVIQEFGFTATKEDLYTEGFFLNRPIQSNIAVVVKNLIAMGEKVFILSAFLTDSKYAYNEKMQIITSYFPEIPSTRILLVPYGHTKADYVPGTLSKHDVLIDDHSPNCYSWQRAGGTYVKVSRDCLDKTYERHTHRYCIAPDETPIAILKTISEAKTVQSEDVKIYNRKKAYTTI